MSFLDRASHIWLMDGAMGTQLLPLGSSCVARANLTHGAIVREVHASYAAAGAEVHLTNTFQVNPIALTVHGLEHRLEEIARAAIGHARQGARGKIILGDVGPVTPGEKDDFADRESLLRALEALEGVDGLLLETCSTPSALTAVEFAQHRVSWLEGQPVLLSIAYRRNHAGALVSRSGHAPEFFARHARRHGVSALGVNCGIGITLHDHVEIVRRYRNETDLPLFTRPSIGAPVEFGRSVPELLAAGATMLGGCCGTTPEHIAALAAALGKQPLPPGVTTSRLR